MRAWIALLLLPLAGCVDEQVVEPEPLVTTDTVDATGKGADCLDQHEEFVTTNPRRYDNLFEHESSRIWLESAMAALDAVIRHEYAGGTHLPNSDPAGVNIIGVINGTAPPDPISGERPKLIIGGHYDSAPTSVQGAYDDGAGTVLAVCMGQLMAQYDWHHDILIALWDQEEAGLIGSEAHAQDLADRAVPVTIAINYDMTGINWPAHPSQLNIPLDASIGGDAAAAFQTLWADAHAAMAYPDEATTSDTGLGAFNSDHASWLTAGYDAAWVTGAKIGRFPGYHNADTFEMMVAAVGGDRSALEGGFQTVLDMTLRWAAGIDEQVRAAGDA